MLHNPVYEFERLKSVMDGLLSADSGMTRYREEADLANVYENDSAYRIEMPAPGVSGENVSVNVSNGMLNVSVKREAENSVRNIKSVIRRERSDIQYGRSFRLPEDADAGAIDAKLENGMLEISVPKKEQAKPMTVSVRVR